MAYALMLSANSDFNMHFYRPRNINVVVFFMYIPAHEHIINNKETHKRNDSLLIDFNWKRFERNQTFTRLFLHSSLHRSTSTFWLAAAKPRHSSRYHKVPDAAIIQDAASPRKHMTSRCFDVLAMFGLNARSGVSW